MRSQEVKFVCLSLHVPPTLLLSRRSQEREPGGEIRLNFVACPPALPHPRKSKKQEPGDEICLNFVAPHTHPTPPKEEPG